MINKKLLSVLLLSATLLAGCANKEANDSSDNAGNTPAVEESQKFTGTVVGEKLSDPTGKKSDVVVASVNFEEGKPVKVDIDVRLEDGTMKKQLSKDGGYVMVEGEEHPWHEQIELLENFLNENGCDVSKVNVLEDTTTDAVSGVSIKVSAYLDAVKEVVDSVENGTTLEEGYTGAKIVEVSSESSKDVVVTKVVFDHSKPVNVSIDVRLEDGTSKKQLSKDGGYVMVEGEEKAWHEQIAELEAFIVENNFDLSKIVLDDNGATDAVSGVSIKVGDYVESVQTALDEVK